LLWMCDALDWRHLPVAGGMYDQHPDFLEGVLILKEVRGRHEDKKRKDEEEKNKQQMNTGRRGKHK
jgi:hypothetical protein